MDIDQIRRESLRYAMGNYGQSKRKWNKLQVKPKKQRVAVTPRRANRPNGPATRRQIAYLTDLLDQKNLGLEYLRKYTGSDIAAVGELTFKQAWGLIASLSTQSRSEVFRRAVKSEQRRNRADRRLRWLPEEHADTRPVAAILKLWPKEALSRMADLNLVPWE
jgi:hypothetical protein